MVEQVRKDKPVSKTERTETADKLPHVEHKSTEELQEELDGLLDEIDEVLEENAAQFIKDFVQAGGQ